MTKEKPIIVLVPGHRTTSVITGKDCCEEARLIHITSSGFKSQFHDLPDWLRTDGYEVYLAQYKNGKVETPSIEQLATWLNDQIEALVTVYPQRQITLVGFSLGGLIVRAYIDSDLFEASQKKIQKNIINSVFLVATPNTGSRMSSFFNLLIDFKSHKKQQACFQFSNTEYMRKFNQQYQRKQEDIPFYLIGTFGSKTLLGHIMSAYLWLNTGHNNDGGCDIANATDLKRSRQIAYAYGSHAKMYGDHCFSDHSTREGNNIYTLCIRPVLKGNSMGCVGYAKTWRTVPLWAFPVSVLVASLFLPIALFRFWWRRLGQLIHNLLCPRFLLKIRSEALASLVVKKK